MAVNQGDTQIKELILKALKEVEETENCRILLAGRVGSTVDGLSVDGSDYDVRAIADGDKNVKSFFRAVHFQGVKIEILLHNWAHVESDILKWKTLGAELPSIHSELKNELIHDDICRSQIRLASMHCVLNRTAACHKKTMRAGMLLRDALDYEYSRAYMNYKLHLQKDSVSVRKYLYTVKELLSILWMDRTHVFPPQFLELLEASSIEPPVRSRLMEIFEINKIEKKEKNYISMDKVINDFICYSLETAKSAVRSNADSDVCFEVNYG